MKDGLLKRRLVRPVRLLLQQGVTPERMALSLTLGVVLGIFPVLGTTTVLCAVAAVVLKLNLPAIQIVNYFLYPVQIALLIPFFRLGELVFRAPHFPVSVAQIREMAHVSVWNTVQRLWTTTWHAIVVWGLLAPVAAGIFYCLLKPVLRRALPAARPPVV